MDDDSLQVILVATSICLLSFLILSIVVAIRTKSFRAGLILFLPFTVFMGIVGSFSSLYLVYWSEDIRRFTTPFLSVILISTLIVQGAFFWLNAKKGGKILHQNKGAGLNIVRYVIAVSFAAIFIFLFLMNPRPPVGADIFLLWGIISVGAIFRSTFEIRENGFVSRGKVILFSDIEHAKWEDLFDKTKLKVRLKSTGQTTVIKTPWEMLMPIDNYIRTNFPRP